MKIKIFFSVQCGFRCKGFDCFYRFDSSFRSRDWDRIAESRHWSGWTRRSSDRIKWLRVVISDQRFDVVARRCTSDVSLSKFRLSTVLLETTYTILNLALICVFNGNLKRHLFYLFPYKCFKEIVFLFLGIKYDSLSSILILIQLCFLRRTWLIDNSNDFVFSINAGLKLKSLFQNSILFLFLLFFCYFFQFPKFYKTILLGQTLFIFYLNLKTNLSVSFVNMTDFFQ